MSKTEPPQEEGAEKEVGLGLPGVQGFLASAALAAVAWWLTRLFTRSAEGDTWTRLIGDILTMLLSLGQGLGFLSEGTARTVAETLVAAVVFLRVWPVTAKAFCGAMTWVLIGGGLLLLAIEGAGFFGGGVVLAAIVGFAVYYPAHRRKEKAREDLKRKAEANRVAAASQPEAQAGPQWFWEKR